MDEEIDLLGKTELSIVGKERELLDSLARLDGAALRERAEEGVSLIITAGGVGAEVKDKTIEAVMLVDPEAATPAVVKYELGVGRHVRKDSVRIAVGRFLDTLIVSRPCPSDEVLLGIDTLVRGLAAPDLNKAALADRIAGALRQRLQEKARAQAHHALGHAPA